MKFQNGVSAAFLMLSSIPSDLTVDSFSATVKRSETPISFLNRVVESTTFNVVEEPSKRGATVLEAPVNQDGVKLFIAIDSDSFCNIDRPGNGGIRLLHYDTTEDAVDDAVRLAKGMTRKHDMFRTGFSGAKVVVNVDSSKCLTKVKRECLMKDTADALHSLEGTMYTGCDLNTSDKDMDYLTEATKNKYVLAGRDSNVDTNIATASSVIGSILGTVEVMEGSLDKIKDLTFTVQGCGKVGGTVAKELVRLGAKKVYTCDLFSDLAKIDGCIPVDDWTKQTCDFLVPCANSLSITEDVASNFPEGIMYCVGAANSPFASSEAKSIFDKRGILHIPESISSAGAILADSVEWFDMNLYQTVKPELMYGWIRDISKKKSASLARHSNLDSNNVDSNLGNVIPSRDGDPVGKEFPEWIKQNTKEASIMY